MIFFNKMADKENIVNEVDFAGRRPSFDELQNELPQLLEQIENMDPKNVDCDVKYLHIPSRGKYYITENKYGPGGEAGLETVPHLLTSYKLEVENGIPRIAE